LINPLELALATALMIVILVMMKPVSAMTYMTFFRCYFCINYVWLLCFVSFIDSIMDGGLLVVSKMAAQPSIWPHHHPWPG
jgi:hypothetical protein